MFITPSSPYLENNSRTTIPTAAATPRCAAAATGTTETSAGTAGWRQSAAICYYSSNRASSSWVPDATSVSGNHPLSFRACFSDGARTPSVRHSKRWAWPLPSACSMHHVLRRGPRASKATLQPAGTGAWRLLSTEEETDRWVSLTSVTETPWCKTGSYLLQAPHISNSTAAGSANTRCLQYETFISTFKGKGKGKFVYTQKKCM